MNRFQLLRLPTVALKEVLKCLNPIELYQLSHCSRKVAKLIPSTGTNKISLEINFRKLEIVMNKSYTFEFRNDSTNEHNDPNTLEFNVPSDTEMVDQLKTSGYYVSALFKCPIKSLEFERVHPGGPCRSIIEEVITSQDSLENLKLSGDLKNEDLKWILEKANVTGNLRIFMDDLENVSIDWKLKCRHLFFNPASWITVANLVSFQSCATITLAESNLTYQDLDGFMEKWKSGMFPNLAFFRVCSSALRNDGKIFGFSKEQLSAEKGFEKEIIVDNEYIATCTAGVDVTNNDGIKGSIQISLHFFELFVWKD